MHKQPSRIKKITKRLLRVFLFSFLAIFLLVNAFILLSGRFYLYKGIANTYLVGKTGPGIYDLDVFPYSTIKKGKPESWNIHSQFNRQKLKKSDQEFMNSLQTSAFLVFRGDTLLYENYSSSQTKNSVSNSFSAAKTVVALLIGIAVEEGKISSIDEPVANYIPEFKGGDKSKITIRHLLMMASGLDWEESSKNPLSENAESYYGTDLHGLVTRQKAVAPPGRKFIYQSGNSQLLGYILEKATNMSVSAYTQEKIWKKIGAEHDAFWSLDKENGDEKAFCCLYATARDFGRLGKLILNQGKFGNTQIVPEWYMKEMVDVPSIGTEEGIPNQRYGLHIWTYDAGENPIYYCRGIKGQYIISMPKENLVIVRLGMERKDNFALPKDQKIALVDEAIKRKVGHPEDFFEFVRIGKQIAADTK